MKFHQVLPSKSLRITLSAISGAGVGAGAKDIIKGKLMVLALVLTILG